MTVPKLVRGWSKGIYLSRPKASRGIKGPSGMVFRRRILDRRLLRAMFSRANCRLLSSMSGFGESE